MSDDDRLLRAASKGDARALETLIGRYATDVYRYMCGMLSDEREAEDAMQEAFVHVARAAGRYDPAAEARTWLFGVVRRVARDHPLARQAPGASLPPESPGWGARALRTLPPDLREVLVMRELLGWDVAAIASVLGPDAGNVAGKLLDAREALVRQHVGA